MALTNAEKQQRWRDKRNALAKAAAKLRNRTEQEQLRNQRLKALLIQAAHDMMEYDPKKAKRLLDQINDAAPKFKRFVP
jgi:phage-related minor tail protein